MNEPECEWLGRETRACVAIHMLSKFRSVVICLAICRIDRTDYNPSIEDIADHQTIASSGITSLVHLIRSLAREQPV